jgi:hypothetical protein
MRAKLNYFNEMLCTNFSGLIILNNIIAALIQTLSIGIVWILILFVIVTVKNNAATINSTAATSISIGMNVANTGDMNNFTESSSVTNHQFTVQAFPVPVIKTTANAVSKYTSNPIISWVIPGLTNEHVTYSVVVRNSADKEYEGNGFFSIDGIDSTSMKITNALTPGATYFYKVIAIFDRSDSTESAELSFTFENITYANNSGLLPYEFKVNQNYPNPFNPSTIINYILPKSSLITVKIYNILGQEVKTLINTVQQAGVYNIQWVGDDNFGRTVASGTYLYRISAGQFVKTMKMMFLK